MASLRLRTAGVVEADVIGEDAVVLGVLDGFEDVGAAQHGLGRDAAPVQADAASAFLFDQGDAESELRGADRGGVAARPAADDDHIKAASARPFQAL